MTRAFLHIKLLAAAFAVAGALACGSCGGQGTAVNLEPQGSAVDRGASSWVGDECSAPAPAAESWTGDECGTQPPVDSSTSGSGNSGSGNSGKGKVTGLLTSLLRGLVGK